MLSTNLKEKGKRGNKRGFTLPELLIVVAIIAVLTAIAIPVFTTQLEKSRQATDLANIRAAYAAASAEVITTGKLSYAFAGPMQHTGRFDKLESAVIGNLDLSQYSRDTYAIVKGMSVIVMVESDGTVILQTGNPANTQGTGYPAPTQQDMEQATSVLKTSYVWDSERGTSAWLPSVNTGYAVPGKIYKVDNQYYQTDGIRWYYWDESESKWRQGQ